MCLPATVLGLWPRKCKALERLAATPAFVFAKVIGWKAVAGPCGADLETPQRVLARQLIRSLLPWTLALPQ